MSRRPTFRMCWPRRIRAARIFSPNGCGVRCRPRAATAERTSRPSHGSMNRRACWAVGRRSTASAPIADRRTTMTNGPRSVRMAGAGRMCCRTSRSWKRTPTSVSRCMAGPVQCRSSGIVARTGPATRTPWRRSSPTWATQCRTIRMACGRTACFLPRSTSIRTAGGAAPHWFTCHPRCGVAPTLRC